MANYTEHYGLHQWVPEDDFLRTDFNADFALIDTALAGLAAADSAQTSALAAAKTELQGSITSGDNNLSLALSQAQTALQNAITSGDNAQAAALSQAQAALQAAITAGDAALDASKSRVAWGVYSGDGTALRFISLGFTPTLVTVTDQTGTITASGLHYGGIAMTGIPSPGVEVAANGFYVKNDGGSAACNYASPQHNIYRAYLYIAVQ